jgi:hypothetical protein
MSVSKLHRLLDSGCGTEATWVAPVSVVPRFSFGWRGFYFAYFFAYASVGSSPHARRRSTA